MASFDLFVQEENHEISEHLSSVLYSTDPSGWAYQHIPEETAGMCGSWSMSEMVADDLLSEFFQKLSSATLLMWQPFSTGNVKVFFLLENTKNVMKIIF